MAMPRTKSTTNYSIIIALVLITLTYLLYKVIKIKLFQLGIYKFIKLKYIL